MVLTEGMDEGPVLGTSVVEVGENETAGELGARLAEIGAPLLVESIQRLPGGRHQAAGPRPRGGHVRGEDHLRGRPHRLGTVREHDQEPGPRSQPGPRSVDGFQGGPREGVALLFKPGKRGTWAR